MSILSTLGQQQSRSNYHRKTMAIINAALVAQKQLVSQIAKTTKAHLEEAQAIMLKVKSGSEESESRRDGIPAARSKV
uniref:Uncharacterized protein n=1 Tax=Caenorhabditis japonica TaxID=281687 RepID=A0A8R1E8L1_CAEJA